MRPPSPVLDESENAGILKMLLLHRQALLVRFGGKVRGIMTWAGFIGLRKTKVAIGR